MQLSTALALIVSTAAITAVNGGPLLAAILGARSVDDVWGGVNITASVLEVYNAISHPTCNATDYCVQLAGTVVPTCLRLQGSAGCWCSLHDPIHYCAICMSSPTDNTTTADQTQAATEGHANYHKGCAAWQAYLNASASGSLTTSLPPSTSSPLPTLTQSAVSDTVNTSNKSVSGGAIAGIVIGGIAFLSVVVAATILIARWMNHKAAHDKMVADAAAAAAASENEKRRTMGSGGGPGYYPSEGGDAAAMYKMATTPPPHTGPTLGYNQPIPGGQPQHPVPMGPGQTQPAHNTMSMYSNNTAPGSMMGRPDSMATDASMYPSVVAGMRQGSLNTGSNASSGQPLIPQTGAYHVTNEAGARSPPPPFSQ